MSAARRLLIAGGIALALLGMIYGVWYAVFAEHQELDGMGRALTASFSASAMQDSLGAGAALHEYKELKYSYDRHVDAHGHWIGLAMVLVVLGIALERMGFSERLTMALAAGLVLGSFLFPMGVLLQTFSRGPVPQAIAVAGSALVIVALAGMAVGFAVARAKE